LSLPLVVIAAHYARRHWREPVGKLLLGSLLIILLCSLGSALVVGGNVTHICLPWAVLEVSVLRNAAPVRFCIYASLIFAIITSLWLSSAHVQVYCKVAIAAVVIVFLLPNLSSYFWVYPVNEPVFFRSRLYRNLLKEGEIVFTLPLSPHNESMLWQAESQFYFRLGGGPGPWPTTIGIWPIAEAFAQQNYVPDAPVQFKEYMISHEVSALIIEDEALPVWKRMASALDITPVKIGGVSLYRLSPRSPASPQPSLIDMRTRFDRDRFETLLIRIDDYISRGGDPTAITAANAPKLGLVPPDALVGPTDFPQEYRHPELNRFPVPRFKFGVYLSVTDDHHIVIGETTWYPCGKELIERYGNSASDKFFWPLYWKKMLQKDPDPTLILIMTFNREQLAKAAAIARQSRVRSHPAEIAAHANDRSSRL